MRRTRNISHAITCKEVIPNDGRPSSRLRRANLLAFAAINGAPAGSIVQMGALSCTILGDPRCVAGWLDVLRRAENDEEWAVIV